jgi:hypothetical protein
MTEDSIPKLLARELAERTVEDQALPRGTAEEKQLLAEDRLLPTGSDSRVGDHQLLLRTSLSMDEDNRDDSKSHQPQIQYDPSRY